MSFTNTYISPRAWRASENPRTRDHRVRIDDVLSSPYYLELRSQYGHSGRYSRRNGRTAFRHVLEMEALKSSDRARLIPGARNQWEARAEMLYGVLERGCSDVPAYNAPHFVRLCDERVSKHNTAARRSHRGEDARYHRRLAVEWQRIAREVADRLEQLSLGIASSSPVYFSGPAYVHMSGDSGSGGSGHGGGRSSGDRGYNRGGRDWESDRHRR